MQKFTFIYIGLISYISIADMYNILIQGLDK